ncbi:MAG: thermonuclease family protein [Syntrophales bacterium]|nr:thermonuclease family protein [Syntrophales bacterium]MDD5640771.1 thermonuclease family protein [Syntrophales bacterium]
MFIAISGTFHVDGYTPDGDSLHFQAHNAANWQKLGGPAVRLNQRQQAQLRLEAIDALEMNFEGRHQPWKYAREALDFLLTRLGIRGNLFGPAHARDGAAGYILARQAEKYRRPVAFVFTGGANWPDGEKVFLDTSLVQHSLNHQLLREGLVYPTYYEGLYPDLREELTRACREARKEQKGFWPRDCTNSGVALDGLDRLTSKCIILPKLFRRLVRFLKDSGAAGDFQTYLEAGPDPVTHLSTNRVTTLAGLVEIQGGAVRLTAAPEDLVFAET